MKISKSSCFLLIITILIFLVSIQCGFSQVSDEKFNLGQAYEKNGDYKSALRIYEELYNSQPKNDKYFQAVVRSYKALNKFTDLLAAVEKQIKIIKTTEVYTIYGEALWLSGKPVEANDAWQQAVDLSPKLPETYLQIAQTQISLRQFEKAISVLKKGRVNLNSPDIFAEELSQLYIVTGNYKEGASEVFNLFDQTGNLTLAQGKLQALMTSETSSVNIKDLLKKRMQDKNSLNYMRLYAWFLLASGSLDESLEVYTKIDDAAKAQGREVLSFAENNRRDGHYDIAMKAYSFIIEKGKSNPLMTSALFGYARTLEQKLQDVKKLDAKSANDIIKQYRDIISDFPNTSTATECKYRIAVIYNNQLNDPDKAINELKDITGKKSIDAITPSATLLLGEIYMHTGKTEDASAIFSGMINMYGQNAQSFQNETDKAKYHLAEIEYYSGNLDSAKAHFELLTTNPKTDIANEALNKVILIDQNKKFPDPLVIYAAAEQKRLQGDNSAAIAKFYEASKLAGDALLAEQSLVKIADIYFDQASYDSTRAVLSRLLSDFPKTIFGDYALLKIGDTFVLESNPTAATKYYNDLLAQYPRSIYLQDTRDKIRKLRATP